MVVATELVEGLPAETPGKKEEVRGPAVAKALQTVTDLMEQIATLAKLRVLRNQSPADYPMREDESDLDELFSELQRVVTLFPRVAEIEAEGNSRKALHVLGCKCAG